MSLNQVNSSGELERVAGLVNSEKINEMYEAFPSDASASNKLVATNAIYKTLNRSWNEVGIRFIKLSNAYPTLGLRTNNYVVSCRNGETYLLLCGTTDGGYTVAPEVYLLYGGTGKLTTNGFYYDSTTKEIAFMTQGYNNVSVTQISGEVKDIILSELSETNPLSDPVAITPQKLVTESDLNPVAITTPTPVSGVTGGDNLIYGFKSGKMVTIVLNGITMANNIMQNQPIFTNVPTAVGNKNIYFTVLDYENGKSAVMSIIGNSLDAAFQSDDKNAVRAGRYWGTVTYMTSD